MAGLRGHRAGQMLICGPEGDSYTGSDTLLKMYHLARSQCQRASSDLTVRHVRSHPLGQQFAEEVRLKSLPLGLLDPSGLPFLMDFLPLLPLPVPCYEPRAGSALAFVSHVVWVNRGLLSLVHKPSSLLKVFIYINKAYF